MLTDEQFACWPISSVHWYAKRTGSLFVSLSTWYKYAHLLGLTRKRKNDGKNSKGIVTSKPNEVLHVDTTVYKLADGTKRSIAFVTDNISRAILGYQMGATSTASNVLCALEHAIKRITTLHPSQICTTLVADDGSENHAATVKELLAATDRPKITKIIAQKDIVFSNSPVEAVNKIFKHYLRVLKPQTERQLHKAMEFFYRDYTYKRPHGSLSGLTPFEAYTNTAKPDFESQVIKAKTLRTSQNQQQTCGVCEQEG